MIGGECLRNECLRSNFNLKVTECMGQLWEDNDICKGVIPEHQFHSFVAVEVTAI